VIVGKGRGHLSFVGRSPLYAVACAPVLLACAGCGGSGGVGAAPPGPDGAVPAALLDAAAPEAGAVVPPDGHGGPDGGADAVAGDEGPSVDDAPADGPNGADSGVCLSPPAGERVLQISSGGGRSCVILSGGAVKCWGYVYGGYLGLGDTSNRGDQPGEMGANLPYVDLGTGKTAVALSLGWLHTCALLNDASIKCWGSNYQGQLGLGDKNDRGDVPGQMGDNLPAVDLGTGRTALAVSAGYAYTCALLDDGTVKCWGSNESGALGLGDAVDRGGQPGQMGDDLPAVDLGPGQTAIAISAGSASDAAYEHTCVVLANGSVKCWGAGGNDLGLGNLVTTNVGDKPGQMGDSLPALSLGTGRTALDVSAAYEFSCALLDDHSVKCWGDGDFLGLGRPDARGEEPGQMGDNLPAVDLGTGRSAVAVTAGYSSACAILDDATIKCWGMNYDGQLGQGDTMDRGTAPGQMGDDLRPVDLGACKAVAQMGLGNGAGAGAASMCALLGNGTVKCWGVGGPLGLGDTMGHGSLPGQMGDNLPTVKLFSDAW